MVRVTLCWRNLAVAQRTDHNIVKPRIHGVSRNGAGAADSDDSSASASSA
jgi:hypothetical protein